jgi:hypothetical protein
VAPGSDAEQRPTSGRKCREKKAHANVWGHCHVAWVGPRPCLVLWAAALNGPRSCLTPPSPLIAPIIPFTHHLHQPLTHDDDDNDANDDHTLAMIRVEVSAPTSPDPSAMGTSVGGAAYQPTLAELSRNASVISSSSSSSSTSSIHLHNRPARPAPAPIRTYAHARSVSPSGPATPRIAARPPPPPAYLRRELGFAPDDQTSPTHHSPPRTRAQSRVRGSRNSSANGRVSVQDFEFGDILGEGSYSTVSLPPLFLVRLTGR